MSRNESNAAIIGLVITVILLLLLGRKGITNITEQKLGNLNVSPQVTAYNLPPLSIADLPPYRGGPWDWMQTTNLGCSCDDNVKQQIFLPPPPEPRRTVPAYVFVAPPPSTLVLPSIYAPSPTPQPIYNYPAYTPPVFTYSKRSQGIFFMTFTDGTGRVNDGRSLPLFVITTSDGEILNAYNRRFSSGRNNTIIYGATTYYPATDADRI